MINPYDAPKSPPVEQDRRPRVGFIRWFLRCYPLLMVGSMYFTWIVGWLTLGRAPMSSLDDPKGIGGLMNLIYPASGVVLMLAPAALLGGVWSEISYRDSVIRRLSWLIILLMTWFVCVMLLRIDPHDVVEWYMD